MWLSNESDMHQNARRQAFRRRKEGKSIAVKNRTPFEIHGETKDESGIRL
jgi:hypothetical protein